MSVTSVPALTIGDYIPNDCSRVVLDRWEDGTGGDLTDVTGDADFSLTDWHGKLSDAEAVLFRHGFTYHGDADGGAMVSTGALYTRPVCDCVE